MGLINVDLHSRRVIGRAIILYQRPLALTRNSLTVMARLVRAIRHRTGLNRMARTSRAMTVLGQHRSPIRPLVLFEIDSTRVTCRRVRASEPAPCFARQPGDPPNQSGEGDDEKGRPHGPEQA
jgi:hypothetical protein